MQYHHPSRIATRQSNMELLRIFAMLIIIGQHFAVHSSFDYSGTNITLNKLWLQCIQIGGKLGVNLFVLISGYYLVKAPKFNIRKALSFELQVFIHSILIYLVIVFAGIESFSPITLLQRLLPITFAQWWFASNYFVLYLLSPFLNILLTTLDKKTYKHFLLLQWICWCLIPTLTSSKLESNDLLWFMFMYSLAGYIRLHNPLGNISTRKAILWTLPFFAASFLSVYCFDVLGKSKPVFGEFATFFFGMQKLPVFFISVLFFIGFLNLHLGSNRCINLISSATFGVYLLHDDIYVKHLIWEDLFPSVNYVESSFLIPYSLFVILLVFTGCTMIELAVMALLRKCERHSH